MARRAALTAGTAGGADMNPDRIAEHIPRLRRYARALVGDQHGADDLVQDTLERAINKRHSMAPGKRFARMAVCNHAQRIRQSAA